MNAWSLKAGLALSALALTASADAGTVVHYHLDELAVSTRGTSSTTFANAANPGTFDGRAVTYNGRTKENSSWLYPTGADGLPSAWRYFDPVSGARHDAGRSLAVSFNNPNANYNWGGGVQADDIAVAGDFTAEMFFCYADWHEGQDDAAVAPRRQPLFCKESATSATVEARPTFGCYLLPDGRVQFQFSGASASYELSAPAALLANDRKWYHLACSYESASRTLTAYVDYVAVATKTLAEGESPVDSAGGALYLGLHPNLGGSAACLTGRMAEFRLSDAALKPVSFIRAERGETLVELSGGLDADPVPAFVKADLSKATYTLSDDTDGATLYAGVFGEGVSGRKAYALNAEARAGGFIVYDEDLSFAANSFTAELGFKFASEAWKSFADDCVYFFSQQGFGSDWHLRCERSNGRIRLAIGGEWELATIPASAWDDGAWHRLAVVSDRENKETRLYLDGNLVARVDGAVGDRISGAVSNPETARRIHIGCGSWDANAKGYSCKEGLFNDIRLTRRALRPDELLTSRHVAGDTLVWAPFDGRSNALVEALVESPSLSGAATLVHANAGELRDADGVLLRARNRGSLSLATGAGAYSRLSLLERPDQTVEFFLRGGADAGTDLIALRGVRGGVTNDVWSLRATDGGLKVMVAGREVASAGASGSGWSHVGLVFAPAADGGSTAVTVYRDYAVVGTGSFDGTLDVAGLSDSSLAFGAFAGGIDELRVSRGALAADAFLRAKPLGFALFVR